MGMYKNFIIGVEELVWDAMEKGFTDQDSIYAYVYMHEPRASRDTVNDILSAIHEDDAQLVMG
jgi:hypothetical protein